MPDHTPLRPSWDCQKCGEPWPCGPARAKLTNDLDLVALALHMWNQLEEAAFEMPHVSATEFFERFIKWTG